MLKSLSILAIVGVSVNLCANAAGDDGVMPEPLIQYGTFNYLHNVENSALNPASLSYVPLKELAVVSAGYDWGNGAYHDVDASGHTDGFGVSAYGIKRLSRTAFEGGVTYRNENSRARCWNSSLFQNSLNPFILADADDSDYNTERFKVYGRVSYDVSQRLRIGINVDYNPGVMSDEKDPRVETKGMRFILNPGVQWRVTPRLAIGATGGIDMLNESSVYTCVGTAVNFKFYLMSGLGTFYPQSGSSYTRDSKGTSWFAGGDVRYDFSSKAANYISVTYAHENEHATDGGSTYQFKAGEYMNEALKVYERFSITGDRNAHNIEIWAETDAVKGRWYDQQSVSENGSTHYEVMSSSIKHKESRSSVKAGYRYDILDRSGASDLTAGVSVAYMSSDVKNYPELYFRKYTRLQAAAKVEKHFCIKNVRMGVGVDGGYAFSPTSSCDFTGMELEESYCMPMYAYLTSSSVAVNGRIDAHLPLGSFILGVKLGGGTERCLSSKLDRYKDKSFSSFNCGVSLFF